MNTDFDSSQSSVKSANETNLDNFYVNQKFVVWFVLFTLEFFVFSFSDVRIYIRRLILSANISRDSRQHE